jgi:hypothetical protein
MDTVNAKLFEWNRVEQDLAAACASLRDAMEQGQPELTVQELYARVARLQEQSRNLLLEVQRLRVAHARE